MCLSVSWFLRGLTGDVADFDNAPIRTTFFDTSIYMIDSSKHVLGGKFGEDEGGRNRAAWKAALLAGHELADHTVNHFNGGSISNDSGPCCRARNWTVNQWMAEIRACRTALASLFDDPGDHSNEVSGFRAPYLSYNDGLYTALGKLGFTYDSSIPNCFDTTEDGSNCSWPYQLDDGSPDAASFGRKVSELISPSRTGPLILGNHPGLWEVPPTTLFVPPDSVASRYGFDPGLRQRIADRFPKPYPSVYEPLTGRITGMDYTLLMDAAVTGDEMRAVLEYNLDLHLAGNHSPLIFVAHSHLYAFSTSEDNPDTPTAAERDRRWRGLTGFLAYARSKPSVRIVGVEDILRWIKKGSSR